MKTVRTLAFAFLVLLGFGFYQGYKLAQEIYLGRAQDDGHSALVLIAEAVDQAVGRYAPIPVLIAGDPAFRDMLVQGSPDGITSFMNEKLRLTNASIGASDIFVLDRSGRTVASSNYRDSDSFVGRNLAFRPYFQDAIRGEAAFFHALGTTSGERGFYFSAPVLDGIEVVGVLVVKMTVGSFEQGWSDTRREILIADHNGIIFMTSRDVYKYRALAPLSDAQLNTIERVRQFPVDRLTPLEVSTSVINDAVVKLDIKSEGGTTGYIAESLPLSLAGWHAIVLTQTGPVNLQIFRALAFGALTVVALILSALLIFQRRQAILQRIRFEQGQRMILEDTVRARTADLKAANTTLKGEVTERIRTEEKLRQSQKDLVQAGKLAALGQMSAAISHEINQPLTAIKSYAFNASEYLARSKLTEAGTNIKFISEMADRMTEISSHLRNFARQPGDDLRAVNVSEVITQTIALVGPQLKASGGRIDFAPCDAALYILGGKLRLQQVFVNIITNALEAMKDRRDPLIEISVKETEDTIAVHLRDYGPGLGPHVKDQVFDAFVTTKDAGVGMGLGLSISYNIISDFGGTITAENHEGGGALFVVTLKRTTDEADTA